MGQKLNINVVTLSDYRFTVDQPIEYCYKKKCRGVDHQYNSIIRKLPTVWFVAVYWLYIPDCTYNWLVDFFNGHSHQTKYYEQTSTLKTFQPASFRGQQSVLRRML